jgi:long-subunit fatty acid transport protein
MRKLPNICLAAALVAVLAAAPDPAVAQEVPDITIIGARARAMGGAHTAVASGVDAIAWNPAGLAEIDHGTIEADLRLNFGSGDIGEGVTAFDAGNVGSVPVVGFEDTPGTKFTYYMLGGAAPLPVEGWGEKLGLVGAAGYRRMIDLLFRQEQLLLFDPGDGSSTPFEHIDDSEGGVDAITLSIAAKPHPRLAVGLNVNFLDGFVEEVDEQVVAFQGQVFFDIEETQRFSISGHSFEAGARLEVTPQITVGATLRPGYNLDLKGEHSRLRTFSLPGTGIGVPDTLITFFPDDRTNQIPTFYGLGAAIRPRPQVLLAADFEYRPWDDSDIVLHTDGGDIDIDTGLYETHSFRVGGEYTFDPGGEVMVPVRLGFRTTPTTLANVDSLSAEIGPAGFRTFRGDRVDGNTITGGVGIHFETVHFDVAYDRTSLTFSEFLFDQATPPGVAPVIIEVEEAISNLYFSSTIHF